MTEKRLHTILALVAIWLMAAGIGSVYAQTPAGTTADKATRIHDTTMLSVQSGSNYIRIEPQHLPTTVTYLPDTAFGPLPTAMITGDTIMATMIFQYATCRMGWQWTIEKAEDEKIMEIKAHESASLLVEPYLCQTTYDDTTAVVCGGLEWNGAWCDTSGVYSITLVNAEGCDSIRSLHLTVYKPVDTDTTADVWDSILWYGKTYTENGDHTIELKDEHECDYSYTLHLTVHTTTHALYEDSQCDSIIYRDKRYTESGEYRDTVVAEDGNRTITTLRLTIGKTSYDEVSADVYEPYTSPSGKIYTESGNYTDTIKNVAGCDSIITVHLTVYETTYDTIEPMTGCDSIVYEGKTYTKSCAYNDTTIAGDGNRTIKNVTMTIHYTTYSEESVQKAGSYTSPRGITYTESGDYTETITNVAGCDSVITLHVTIGEVYYDTVYFCRGYNYEHEAKINEVLIRRFLPYTYEVPSSFNYREGMILEKGENQVLVDFNIAETNLRNHYSNGLTPIDAIAWSIRYPGAGAYEPIVLEEGPQWINYGILAVQILFRCGETYNDALPMGVEETEAQQQAIKRIENGQVVIIRGGAAYTLMGQRICNW